MIKSLQTTYAGCTFRSRTEARWAVWFDAVGVRFNYEAEGFLIRSGAYLPDFWLPELRLFFEVKGDDLGKILDAARADRSQPTDDPDLQAMLDAVFGKAR